MQPSLQALAHAPVMVATAVITASSQMVKLAPTSKIASAMERQPEHDQIASVIAQEVTLRAWHPVIGSQEQSATSGLGEMPKAFIRIG